MVHAEAPVGSQGMETKELTPQLAEISANLQARNSQNSGGLNFACMGLRRRGVSITGNKPDACNIPLCMLKMRNKVLAR
jgi:hypothetical protein